MRDTQATAELYFKLIAEYERYGLDLPPSQAYSAASLGKQALRQMGIKGFMEQNPDFPPELIGKIMSAYYGGRVEVKIRKTPTRVTYMDFLSMYPTLFVLLDLWKHAIAESVTYEDATEETQKLLEHITLEDLSRQDTWKKLCVLVELQPDETILPVRGDYDPDSSIPNIGINYFTDNKPHWYALPDVLAHKLLTGKAPKIKSAIKFTPKGQQPTLQNTTIFGEDFDPRKQDFFKELIERRRIHKQRRNQSKQKALKILANSSSYGIFVEFNPTDQAEDVNVYCDQTFSAEMKNYEDTGEYFHPLIAVFITAGARLLLAMAEAKIQELGETHAYMDTDSVLVPPHTAKEVQRVFSNLNPYDFEGEVLEIEHEGIWFYGISSKRYCLYQLFENDVIIREHKLHGLGHLTNPFPNKIIDWQEEIWHDIITLHYNPGKALDLQEKYRRFYAVTKRSVSTPEVHKWFKHIQGIKPFNFFLEGLGATQRKPITPYMWPPQKCIYEDAIDAYTGETISGIEHWQPLVTAFFRYIDHPEPKFENGNSSGIMTRRHVKNPQIAYIGKEVRNLDVTEPAEPPIQLQSEKMQREEILNMSIEERKRKGWSRQRLYYQRKKLMRVE